MFRPVLRDSLLGFCDLSVCDFMGGESFRKKDWFKLSFKDKKGNVSGAGELRMDIEFQPSRMGYLVITCFEGRGLKNMELIGKQDPYCKFTLGKLKKRGQTIPKGGTDPYFGEEEITFWIDERNWQPGIVFECFDEDIASDDLIGKTAFSVLPFMTGAKNHEEFLAEGTPEPVEKWYEIFQGKKRSGEVLLKMSFYTAGELMITSIEGKNLAEADAIGRQDPYIVYELPGNAVNYKRKTKTDTDGGTEPRWDEITKLPVVDHHELTMKVFDEDTLGSDDLIGGAAFSLLEVFKRGTVDQWIPLRNKDSWGKVSECGRVHILLDFKGPPGVAYPQLQPDMDAFDDSGRVDRLAKEEEERKKEEERKRIQELKRRGEWVEPGTEGREMGADGIQKSTEFTDREIEDAFRFIDLDSKTTNEEAKRTLYEPDCPCSPCSGGSGKRKRGQQSHSLGDQIICTKRARKND